MSNTPTEPKRKHHVLQLLDDVLLANTTSNAQLMLLYDEVERLFRQQEQLLVTLKTAQSELTALRHVHTAAMRYLRAVRAQNGSANKVLRDLITATNIPAKHPKSTPDDPNKTNPPRT